MNMSLPSPRQFPSPEEVLLPDRTLSRHHLEVVRHTDALAGDSLAKEPTPISDNATGTAILFGPFRLLPAQRLLLEGDIPVRLGSRALEILIALVEQHGELVSKNALMARVWPDTTVVEANLSVHVAALRRALRDDGDGSRYLVNMPGRDYRFVAPITLVEDSESSMPIESPTKPLHNLPKLLTPLVGRDDNEDLAAHMRETHGLCDEYGDVPTASLLEVWIDEAERRVWFLFEASRACESPADEWKYEPAPAFQTNLRVFGGFNLADADPCGYLLERTLS